MRIRTCIALTRDQQAGPNIYVLEDAPYPSGQLHMAMWQYAIGDALPGTCGAGVQRAAPHGVGRVRPPAENRRAQEQ